MIAAKQSNLENYIRGEKYLQNSPLTADDFVNEARLRGIRTSLSDLEALEKERLMFPIFRIRLPILEQVLIKFVKKDDATEWARPVEQGLQAGELEVGRFTTKQYSNYGFDENFNPFLLNWLEKGILFDPKPKDFEPWASFGGDTDISGDEIVSFYSVFQIHWILVINDLLSINCYPTGGRIGLSSRLSGWDGADFYGGTIVDDYSQISETLTDRGEATPLANDALDMRKKREVIRSDTLPDFEKVLWFLLNIQTVFYPYSKSGARNFQITGDADYWHHLTKAFDAQSELDFLDVNANDIASYYQIFAQKAIGLLGGETAATFEWMQLWKNIGWDKKTKLEGPIRLGIDYLQSASMLKLFLERFLNREVFDIDEISRIEAGSILELDPTATDLMAPRGIRNQRNTDPDTGENYFYNLYKHLLYQANDFGIDYQPRILLIVEGETEEDVLPQLFSAYGTSLRQHGIQLINLRGINKLFGEAITLKNEGTKKYEKKLMSNLTHLISYVLHQFQTIPYLIGDNEGGIAEQLKAGIAIDFNGEPYCLPGRWYHLWDRDFEFDNFSFDEIAFALTEILETDVSVDQIRTAYDNRKGISSISGLEEEIKRQKVHIGNMLVAMTMDGLRSEARKATLEKPIFGVINSIVEMANRNHMPTDREHELMNIKTLHEWLAES